MLFLLGAGFDIDANREAHSLINSYYGLLRSRTSRQNSHINPPLCNSLSLRPKIVSPALSQHHEGRQLKSDPRNRFVIDKAGNQDSGLFRAK